MSEHFKHITKKQTNDTSGSELHLTIKNNLNQKK